MKIGILGAGHLGKSIINGLINSKKYQRSDFKIVVNSNESQQGFKKEGFLVSQDWKFIQDCEVIILALLPYNIIDLKSKLQTTFKKKMILSVASGVTLKQLQVIFPTCVVTRVMPNTSVQYNQSMTMITKEGAKAANRVALDLFKWLGKTIILSEKQIDTFIAICGSASAYLYYWLQPLMNLAIVDDISEADSKVIITNLLLGVAANISNSSATLEMLQNQVATTGGTTIEAIKVFDEYHLKDVIKQAIEAVAKKSVAQSLE